MFFLLLGLPFPVLSEWISVGGKSLVEYTYLFMIGYLVFSDEEIVNKIRLQRNDIAWIGIDIKGTNAIVKVVKADEKPEDIDCCFSGDLLNQCIGSSFDMRDLGFCFAGLYGACSTMALSLALAGIFVDSCAAKTALAAASSHFCSAERQYRLPRL